jgi:hypothetical protein
MTESVPPMPASLRKIISICLVILFWCVGYKLECFFPSRHNLIEALLVILWTANLIGFGIYLLARKESYNNLSCTVYYFIGWIGCPTLTCFIILHLHFSSLALAIMLVVLNILIFPLLLGFGSDCSMTAPGYPERRRKEIMKQEREAKWRREHPFEGIKADIARQEREIEKIKNKMLIEKIKKYF